jgi:hypothetical protein
MRFFEVTTGALAVHAELDLAFGGRPVEGGAGKLPSSRPQSGSDEF